jgi:hypothetical protein
MWKAESHSGDYHNNMNSKNFSKWVDCKLIPSFEKIYPNKKMIVICDNAPYHHKRQIGRLSLKSKQQLLQLGTAHKIYYINLSLSVERLELLSEIGELLDDVQYHEDEYCRVAFDVDTFKQQLGSNKPFVSSLDKLKFGIMRHIKNNKPEL